MYLPRAQAAQPALLYIVPGVLGCVALHAAIKGELKPVRTPRSCNAPAQYHVPCRPHTGHTLWVWCTLSFIHACMRGGL